MAQFFFYLNLKLCVSTPKMMPISWDPFLSVLPNVCIIKFSSSALHSYSSLTRILECMATLFFWDACSQCFCSKILIINSVWHDLVTFSEASLTIFLPNYNSKLISTLRPCIYSSLSPGQPYYLSLDIGLNLTFPSYCQIKLSLT